MLLAIGMAKLYVMFSINSWDLKGEYVNDIMEFEGFRADMISGRTSEDRVMFTIRLNSIASLSSFFSFLFTKHIFTPFCPV
jgi:hypothetical protein